MKVGFAYGKIFLCRCLYVYDHYSVKDLRERYVSSNILNSGAKGLFQ